MEQNEKIKLLILTPTLQCGGSEKYVALLCNHINTDKFDVTVGVLNNAAPFYVINNAAIAIVDLKAKQTRHSLFKILSVIKKCKPQIVFSTSNHLNLYLAIFKRRLPKNIILLGRESSIVSINSKRAKLPVLYTWLLKKYYKRIDGIICQSVFMQQDLINNFNINKSKTVVINNAVEIPAGAVKVLNNGDLPKFITVARLSEEKGIDRLIRAVAKLPLPYSFYIIGSGNMRQQLQAIINNLHLQNKIFIKGERANPFAEMEDANLFLMGSHYEGFPNTVLEANAMGIPVIAFDVPGGISEIITNKENGMLVQDNDIDGFAQAIQSALENNFDRQKISNNARLHYSAANIINCTEAVLISIFTNKKL